MDGSPSEPAPSGARSTGFTGHLRTVVEIGGAVAGLAVYVTVIGGLNQWVKLEAAGLPGDEVMSSYATTSLTASGVRVLVVLPIVFCILLVLMRAIDDEGDVAKRSPTARVWDRLPDLIIQTMVVAAGALVGLSATSALASVSGDYDLLHVLEMTVVDLLFFLFYSIIPTALIAIRAWRRRRRSRARRHPHGGTAKAWPRTVPSDIGTDGTATEQPTAANERLQEPRLLSWIRRRTSPVTFVRIAVAGLLLVLDAFAGAVLLMLALQRDDGTTIAIAVVAVIVLCLPYVLLTLRLSAEIWQATERAEEAGSLDETSVLLGNIVIAAVILPLWIAALVVPVLVLVFVCGHAPLAPRIDPMKTPSLPTSRIARALIVSAIVAMGAIAVQTRQPQRFARASFPVGPELTAEAALLGRADGHVLLGVCARADDGTSGAVELLRIPEDRVPAYRVVDDGYTFYRDREPTLLSGFLDRFGLAPRPPTFLPPGDTPPDDVCGPDPEQPSWVFDQLRVFQPPAKP